MRYYAPRLTLAALLLTFAVLVVGLAGCKPCKCDPCPVCPIGTAR